MKTLIEFKDGRKTVVPAACPTFQPDERTMVCINEDYKVITGDVDLDEVVRVVFEPEER